jgi:hypothetical protein
MNTGPLQCSHQGYVNIRPAFTKGDHWLECRCAGLPWREAE